MQINVDFKRYSKKLLKKMEKQLKTEKGDIERELLKKEIEKHKERYFEYLNL